MAHEPIDNTGEQAVGDVHVSAHGNFQNANNQWRHLLQQKEVRRATAPQNSKIVGTVPREQSKLKTIALALRKFEDGVQVHGTLFFRPV